MINKTVIQKIESVALMMLERFLDVPTDAVLGIQAYQDIQKEFYNMANSILPRIPNESNASFYYSSFGPIHIRLDRSVKPDHVSLGKYTPEQAALLSTLRKLDLLAEEFYILT